MMMTTNQKTLSLIFLVVGSLLSCGQNSIRKEVLKNNSQNPNMGSLRDYGKKANAKLVDEAAEIDNQATIKELEKQVAAQSTEINELIQKNMRLSHSYLLLGIRYKESKMYVDAIKAFKKAIEITPASSNLYYQIAFCLGQQVVTVVNKDEQQAMHNEAADYLEKAVQFDAQNYEAMYALAINYAYFQNNFEKAQTLLRQLDPVIKTDSDYLFLKVRVAAGLRQYDQANALLDQIIAQTRDNNVKALALENKKQIELRR